MTRHRLLTALVAAPAAALLTGGAGRAASPFQGEPDSMTIGPGTITVHPSGGIYVTGASDIRIENCTFEPLKETRAIDIRG